MDLTQILSRFTRAYSHDNDTILYADSDSIFLELEDTPPELEDTLSELEPQREIQYSSGTGKTCAAIGMYNKYMELIMQVSGDKFKNKKLFAESFCTSYEDYKRIEINYSLEELIISDSLSDHILEYYTCSICCEIMYPCVVLYCGHSYCEKCASHVQDKYKCLFCRAEITGFTTNFIINNFFNALKIKCPYECNWTGNLNNIKDHTNKCCNMNIHCNKCNQDMKHEHFKMHCDLECTYRKSVCRFCNKVGPHKYLVEHENICPEKPIYCNMCKKEYTYNNKYIHQNYECEYRQVNCSYCSTSVTLHNFSKHNEICSGLLNHCPCCAKFSQKTLVRNADMSKHMISCKYYTVLNKKYFWINHYMFHILSNSNNVVQCKSKNLVQYTGRVMRRVPKIAAPRYISNFNYGLNSFPGYIRICRYIDDMEGFISIL